MEPPPNLPAPRDNAPDATLLPLADVRVIVLYMFFGSLWVIGSDAALDRLQHHDPGSFELQTLKGLNFVFSSTVLLYFVLRRSFRRWRSAQEQTQRSRRRLRALSGRLQSIREEERHRIAREIHDELGQMLTGLKLELRWVERRLSLRSDTSLNFVLDKIVEATELTDATINSVQRIAADLRPGVLDDLGLGPALENEVARFQERTGVLCHREGDTDLPALHPDTALAAFRIAQEALTNVARHAQATRVRLAVGATAHNLELRIEDNGRGVDAADVERSEALGVLGMKERASSLGGEVAIERGPEGGTVVRLHLPLRAAPVASPAAALALP